MPKNVAYLTDVQCRQELLNLIDRINDYAITEYECDEDLDYYKIYTFWTDELDYDHYDWLEY